jgi:hypothetical protein
MNLLTEIEMTKDFARLHADLLTGSYEYQGNLRWIATNDISSLTAIMFLDMSIKVTYEAPGYTSSLEWDNVDDYLKPVVVNGEAAAAISKMWNEAVKGK